MKTYLSALLGLCLLVSCFDQELPEVINCGPKISRPNNMLSYPGQFFATIDEEPWRAQVPFYLINCTDVRVSYTPRLSSGAYGYDPGNLRFFREFNNLSDGEASSCKPLEVHEILEMDLLDTAIADTAEVELSTVRFIDCLTGATYDLDTLVDHRIAITAHHLNPEGIDYFIGKLDFEVVNREDATDRRSIRNADFSAAAELD